MIVKQIKQRLEKLEQQLAVTAEEDTVIKITANKDGSVVENPPSPATLKLIDKAGCKINVRILPGTSHD